MYKEQVKKVVKADQTSSEYLQQTAEHVTHKVKRIRSGASQYTVLIRKGDIDAHVEPVSGANVNVMDEYQFNKALKHRSIEIKELRPMVTH